MITLPSLYGSHKIVVVGNIEDSSEMDLVLLLEPLWGEASEISFTFTDYGSDGSSQRSITVYRILPSDTLDDFSESGVVDTWTEEEFTPDGIDIRTVVPDL